MKKTLMASSLLFLSFAIFAVDVDVTELKDSPAIEFVNYSGPLTIFQTDMNIRGIGRELANQISRGTTAARYLLKYTAIHAVDSAEPDRLGADIISIDKDATVDHIDNVRRILSSYIERLYSYPRKDCDLLAVFVSYYNAANRVNISYFSGRYKKVVMGHLEAARVGLSTKYYEWPGASQVVIPLTEKPAGEVLGALSTTELTSKAVTDQLKAREDKGIDERKAMTELKQREVDQGQKKIAEEAQKLEQQKQATAAQESALQKEKLAAEAAPPEQAKAAAEAVKAKEAEVAAQKADQRKQEAAIASQEKALEAKKQEIAAEKKDIASDQVAVATQQNPEKVQQELQQKSAELAQKEAEVAKREELAKKAETDASIFQGLLYYLKIKEYLTGGHYNNEIYAINAATAKIVVKSPVANICGRKYDIFKDGVVVITHNGDHRAGHYLTLLDLKTLQPKASGTDVVFWRSFVEVKDDMVYAILNRADAYYLGKFGVDMKPVAVSKDKVDPDSFISFFGDLIYINAEDKKILVLNKADLATSGTIEP